MGVEIYSLFFLLLENVSLKAVDHSSHQKNNERLRSGLQLWVPLDGFYGKKYKIQKLNVKSNPNKIKREKWV